MVYVIDVNAAANVAELLPPTLKFVIVNTTLAGLPRALPNVKFCVNVLVPAPNDGSLVSVNCCCI